MKELLKLIDVLQKNTKVSQFQAWDMLLRTETMRLEILKAVINYQSIIRSKKK